MSERYLKASQLRVELEKCLQCRTKPCMKACPVKCSPCDFIAMAKRGDFAQAAQDIWRQNPLGEVCGLVCPDKFCVKACLRANLDYPIKIPAVQAEIMRRARQNGELKLSVSADNGRKIAVVGLGPAGIGAAAEALRYGFSVEVFEQDDKAGGAVNLIPQDRLPAEVLQAEWQRFALHPRIKVHYSTVVQDYQALLAQGFEAVIVCIGEQKSRRLGIVGEELIVDYVEYLKNPQKYTTGGGHVMIIGGGAAAVDCALTAVEQGAHHTEMLVRRRFSDMRITAQERDALLQAGVDITTMTRPLKAEQTDGALKLYTIKTAFDDNGKLADIDGGIVIRDGIALIISALGSERSEEPQDAVGIIYAGDFTNGGSTVVEAIASGQQVIRRLAESLDD